MQMAGPSVEIRVTLLEERHSEIRRMLDRLDTGIHELRAINTKQFTLLEERCSKLEDRFEHEDLIAQHNLRMAGIGAKVAIGLASLGAFGIALVTYLNDQWDIVMQLVRGAPK